MSKKLLKSITSLTMVGGALLGTSSDPVKAEVQSGGNSVVFNDVPKNHWANNAITSLANRNIIGGYGNGVFGLGDNATREQVAALIYRVLAPAKKGGTLNKDNSFYIMQDGSQLKNPYKDINKNSTMFLEEILFLTDIGVFKGDQNGEFRPKESLSRAEMAQVIKTAFKVPVLSKHTFNDVPDNSWAKDAISAVQSNKIASGTGNGGFEPNKTVTREQYAQFLFNALNYREQLNTQNPDVTKPNKEDTSVQTEVQLLEAYKKDMKNYINNHEEDITITYKSKQSNIREVMDTLVKAYDETVDSNEYMKYNVANTQYSIRGIPGDYVFTLKITYRESKEQMNYVKTQAKSVITSIVKAGMDEHEKVKAIHDYVVKHVSYDTSFQAYTAYEALANRSAVCQGYALLTYQLLKEAGVEGHIVTGTGNGQPHAWNLVKIEGKWYHLDTTFDDPIPDVEGRVTYSYYNLSDEQIAKDHQWDRNQFAKATTIYNNELTNKIQIGSPKAMGYQKILTDIKR
ncbi:S-layer protein [Bacillus cereus]|nr:S-layer protein [Bacillus cereus]